MRITVPSTGYRRPSGDPARRGVIALVTEGTYPTAPEGAGTWCPELVTGLPGYLFDIYALSATGTERPAWELPGNVATLVKIPLWATKPGSRPRFREAPAAFRSVCSALLFALFADDPRAFLPALKGLHACVRNHDLGAALLSETGLRQLHDFWIPTPLLHGDDSRRAPAPTVADVFETANMIEHFLRPASVPIAPADLHHSSSNGLARLVAMAGKWQYGAPFLLTEHGVDLRERYLSLNRNEFSHPVRMVLRRFFSLLPALACREADQMTPVSTFNARWPERNGADMTRLRPIHNVVDPAALPESDVRPAVPTLAFVGRIGPPKDRKTLIKATAIIRESIPDVKLRLFGNIPKGNEGYPGCLDELIRKRSLDNTIRLGGTVPRDRIVDAYRAGDIVVLSSISEGFPYTVVEAMMSGRATVSTDVGGGAEAVGDAGIVVPPRDPAAFAAACVRLFEDQSERERLARRARGRALELFRIERFLILYRGACTELGTQPRTVVAHERAPMQATLTPEFGQPGSGIVT